MLVKDIMTREVFTVHEGKDFNFVELSSENKVSASTFETYPQKSIYRTETLPSRAEISFLTHRTHRSFCRFIAPPTAFEKLSEGSG